MATASEVPGASPSAIPTPDWRDYASFPRPQRGSQPQLLLLTILANYWLHDPAPIPSAALVELLEDLDVSSSGARTTLSRMGKRGLLTSTKVGRRTFYRLTDQPAWVLAHRTAELLGAVGCRDWDGRWTCVAFSVPNDDGRLRPQLRTQLRELGFAGLYDGLWICPRPPGEALERVLGELSEVGAATVLRATIDPESGGRQPLDAFDLDVLERSYLRFLDTYTDLLQRCRSGGLNPTEAMAARTRATNEWRRLGRLDPDLPAELLPSTWPRQRARSLFVDLYDRTVDLAALRFDEVVSSHDPSLAGLVRAYTSARPPTAGDLPRPQLIAHFELESDK